MYTIIWCVILANISVFYYNISEYEGQRTLVFYLYPMYNVIYLDMGRDKYCIAVLDGLIHGKLHHDLPQQVWSLFWFGFLLHKSQGMLNSFPRLTIYNSLKSRNLFVQLSEDSYRLCSWYIAVLELSGANSGLVKIINT